MTLRWREQGRGQEELLRAVQPYTKTSQERLTAMVAALRHIEAAKIAGDIVECGVWRAGNIMLARRLCPDRLCWLYDTFEGMTEPTDVDMNRGGIKAMVSYSQTRKDGRKWAECSLEETRNYLSEFGVLDESKLRFVKGPVEETLLVPANIPKAISLLRLDTDWHASTKIEMEVLYPRLKVGGVLIVDDYGHWQGARKAVDEYLGTYSQKLEWIDYTAVCLVKT